MLETYIKNLSGWHKLVVTTLLLGLAVFLNYLSANYVVMNFPERPINPDLIHKTFSHSIYLEYLADILQFTYLILFIYFEFIGKLKNLPYFFANLGVMYIFRAFFGILTPMMTPLGVNQGHGIFRNIIYQPIMFTSGHIGLSFLLFLLTDKSNRKLKIIMWILFVLQTIFMVVSRGHYTIDAIGAILLSYIVYRELQPYKKALTLKHFK